MSRERELLPCDEELLAWALDAYESDASRQYRAQAYYFMRDDFLPHVRALLAEAPAPVTPETPMAYRCGDCGAEKVKLWREYQTTLENQHLRCRACAEVQQGKPLDLSESDTIGWLVPAVPTDDGTFWGYTSVPEPGVAWWKSLPERAAQPKPLEDHEFQGCVRKCGLCHKIVGYGQGFEEGPGEATDAIFCDLPRSRHPSADVIPRCVCHAKEPRPSGLHAVTCPLWNPELRAQPEGGEATMMHQWAKRSEASGDFTVYTVIQAEGGRLGITTCKRCGAAVLLDEEHATVAHLSWHLEQERRASSPQEGEKR